jgi:hypothetical protein
VGSNADATILAYREICRWQGTAEGLDVELSTNKIISTVCRNASPPPCGR